MYDSNDLTNAIETFITDEYGNYTLHTPLDLYPDVYTIMFQPGGTDVSTGKEVKSTMSSISTKATAISSGSANLNITPISTIFTTICQNKTTEWYNPINANILDLATAELTSAFNISSADLTKDYISEANANMAKLVQQIELTVNTLTSAIDDSNVDQDTIISSLANTISNTNTTINLSDSTNITSIITQVTTDNTSVTINSNVITNSTAFISTVNTTISNIDTSTTSFDAVFTEASKIKVASDTIASDANTSFTSAVSAPTTTEINNVSITIVHQPPEPEPAPEPEPEPEPQFADKNALQIAVNLWTGDTNDHSSALTTYGEINNWDVSNITDMSTLFQNKTTFNDDISNWNTSNVTNMGWMFKSASAFNQPIGSWDVSKVTTMDYMLYASAFNKPLDNWNVSSVNNMKGMFGSINSFNQDISGWDVSNVTNLSYMFVNASIFDQDIRVWSVANNTNLAFMFFNANTMTATYGPNGTNPDPDYGDEPNIGFFNYVSPPEPEPEPEPEPGPVTVSVLNGITTVTLYGTGELTNATQINE